MSGFDIATILDKKDRTLPKPINIHPSFDMRLFDSRPLYSRMKHPFNGAYGPRIHKSHMAICFGCWKLIKIDNVQPKKSFHFTRRRYVDCLVPSDLMTIHWDNDCDKPKTDFRKARIIQTAYQNYKKKPESESNRIWEANKKFLGITPRKIRLPETSYVGYGGRTILAKDVPAYARNLPEMFYYYSPKSWADAKKYQLQKRLYNHVLNLLGQQGYRVINSKQWYVMLKWIQNPELYIDNKYPPFIRIE
ncbi:hypothetical protein C2G38_2245851 [Gigaspora rosea]|uniref:Uncharacterized protein n=1 Tax=Gigaspora rosea TaxID=44941 RepID=A0A397V7E1_9GLOM|nr:hypothetical protein C2G38_2245851 [Gigaspora rosea]